MRNTRRDEQASGSTPDSSGSGLSSEQTVAALAAGRFGNAFELVNAHAFLVPTEMAWVRRNGSPGPYRTLAA